MPYYKSRGKEFRKDLTPGWVRLVKRAWKRWARRSGKQEVKDQLKQEAQPEYVDPASRRTSA